MLDVYYQEISYVEMREVPAYDILSLMGETGGKPNEAMPDERRTVSLIPCLCRKLKSDETAC